MSNERLLLPESATDSKNRPQSEMREFRPVFISPAPGWGFAAIEPEFSAPTGRQPGSPAATLEGPSRRPRAVPAKGTTRMPEAGNAPLLSAQIESGFKSCLAGGRYRMWLRFAEWPPASRSFVIGHWSYAPLAMPGHRSGPAVLGRPARLGRRFSGGCTSRRAIHRPDLFLKIFFCCHQAQDLRQIRAPQNLTC